MLKFILNLLFSKQNKPQIESTVANSSQQHQLVEYITLNDWITSSGSYPDRVNSVELTEEVINNAKVLLSRVNKLLNDLKWEDKIKISSGFRPSNINANVKGSAKKSGHMTGNALDILQLKPNNKLGELIRKTQNNQGKLGILGINELMMEQLESTIGQNTNWVHLDTINRPERPSMEFRP